MLIKEILEATKGKLLSGHLETKIKGFSQDTRKINEGDMYIALIGENTDGHQYIEQAFLNGACAVLTSKEVNYPDKDVILVEDTFDALTNMAKYIRETKDVKIVGITGSVGKTSTKDMIYSVVKTQYKTLKTLGNYNNEIGLPLTMLRYDDEEVMILEMGMNHLNEISHLSHIARPHVAAITNVGTAHIGELGSRENILKAKMEIVDGMSLDGTLIINNDNDMLCTVSPDCHVIRVSVSEQGDVLAHNIELGIESSTFDYISDEKTYKVFVPVSGEHFVHNALVALAVGKTLNIPVEKCIEGIKNFELTKNRMDVMTINHDIKVIDGTYNANVDSMKSSLNVLAQYKTRKIAVLADMLELGEYEQQLHEEVGAHVASLPIDVLLCVGPASQHIVSKAKSLGFEMALHFEDNDSLKDYLNDYIEEKDTLLIKGSNGMNLKEVVLYLKERL